MKQATRCKYFLLPALFLAALCLVSPAFAQTSKEISESEKAVFSYFKLAKQTPDFRRWIKYSGLLDGTPADVQEEIYEQESLRLQWGFGTYDPAVDALKIVADVYLQMKNRADGPVLNFKFLSSGKEEIPFFPYPYGDQAIALVVNDLGNFTTVPLTKEQHEKISRYLLPKEIYQGKVTIRVRPKQADSNAPMNLYGMDQWLMMGDTGYLKFSFTPQGGQEVDLWEYVAPWYLSDTEKALLPLLGK